MEFMTISLIQDSTIVLKSKFKEDLSLVSARQLTVWPGKLTGSERTSFSAAHGKKTSIEHTQQVKSSLTQFRMTMSSLEVNTTILLLQ